MRKFIRGELYSTTGNSSAIASIKKEVTIEQTLYKNYLNGKYFLYTRSISEGEPIGPVKSENLVRNKDSITVLTRKEAEKWLLQNITNKSKDYIDFLLY